MTMSHNQIRELTGIENNTSLTQLRVNDNKIMRIPETISSSALLEILDLGNNKISGKEYIKDLKALPKLQQVNLKGNPMKESEEDIVAYAKEMCSKLLIINNRRVVPKRGRRPEKLAVKQEKKVEGGKEEAEKKPILAEKPSFKQKPHLPSTSSHPNPAAKKSSSHKKLEEAVPAVPVVPAEPVNPVNSEPEKKEDLFEVSEEQLKKIETGKRGHETALDTKKARASGIVNVESKKAGMKKKKVTEHLIETQKSVVEKWN